MALSDDPTLTWYNTMLCTLDLPDKAFKELSAMLLQDPWSHNNADLIERRSGPKVWLVTCLSLPINHTAVHILLSLINDSKVCLCVTQTILGT